jgi:hypothetical protein
MYRYDSHDVFPPEDRAGPLAAFVNRFQRSKKGNLWRYFQGMTLTIFARAGLAGTYSWCISDGGEPRFSRAVFASEAEALESLANELGLED